MIKVLVSKKDKNKNIRKYFELREEFGPEVMAAAKQDLREAVYNCMSLSWMHNHAMNRKFSKKNVEIKKQVFYKYLVNFTLELKNNNIPDVIDRDYVLNIEEFQNWISNSEKNQHPYMLSVQLTCRRDWDLCMIFYFISNSYFSLFKTFLFSKIIVVRFLKVNLFLKRRF